jgi:hypothetical protein
LELPFVLEFAVAALGEPRLFKGGKFPAFSETTRKLQLQIRKDEGRFKSQFSISLISLQTQIQGCCY